MKKGWEYKKLKEIGQTQTGTTPPKSEKANYGDFIPFIRPAELNIDGNGSINFNSELKLSECGVAKSRLIKAQSILMCCIGSVGKTGFSDRDVTCNQQINTLTPNEDYEPKLIYYALIAPSFQNLIWKIANSAKATLAIISKGKWEELSIRIPPLSEQKGIVEYLDSSFAKIDTLKANAAKNLDEAKALFQSALKDALEPKEGWEEKTLPDISENLDSRRIPITKGKRDSGKYPYYGASGIVDYVGDYIFDEDILLLSEDGANLLARSTPIAFSVSGKVWVNNHAHILKFKDMCTQRFVEYFFASKDISEYVTGAAQPKLSQKKMNIIPISIPSLPEQQSIVSFLDSLNEKLNTLQQNYSRICNECDALKQAILRQVFE